MTGKETKDVIQQTNDNNIKPIEEIPGPTEELKVLNNESIEKRNCLVQLVSMGSIENIFKFF